MSFRKESSTSKAKKGAWLALFLVLIACTTFFYFKRSDSTEQVVSTPKSDHPDHAIAITAEADSYSPMMESAKPKISLKVETPLPFQPNLGVRPPIKGLIQKPKISQVIASIGGNIKTQHKSTIYIPPSAFVDRNGKIVEGNVDIAYKEYYTPVDIFLSGIPMRYDSGANEQLISAGMIEITATQNGQELFMNPTERVSVMLAALSDKPDYNIYFFDPKQNKWVYKSKDNVTATSTGLTTQKKMVIDSSEVKFQYTEEEYSIALTTNSDMEKKRENIFSRKKTPNFFEFKIQSTTQSPEESKFLRSIIWKYTGEDALETYKQLTSSDGKKRGRIYNKNFWKKLSIEKSENEGKYFLHASNDSLALTLEVTPVITTTGTQKYFDKSYSAYTAAYQKRMNAENARFMKFQTDSANYYSIFGKWRVTSTSMDVAISRSFQMDGFGIWNCDKPQARPNNTVMASFTDKSGKTLLPYVVYIVDKASNTVYTYGMSEFSKLRFNRESENLIFSVLPNGHLAYLTAKEFKECVASQSVKCVFKLTVDDSEIQSAEYLKSKLKFS
jgi:hypothetical protein